MYTITFGFFMNVGDYFTYFGKSFYKGIITETFDSFIEYYRHLIPFDNPYWEGSFRAMLFNLPFANFFWAGMVPSIWLWLNLAAIIITRLLSKTSRIFGSLFNILDVDEHPIRSVGFVAGTIGSGAYGVFLIIINVLF
jgi:hypothetical protein